MGTGSKEITIVECIGNWNSKVHYPHTDVDTYARTCVGGCVRGGVRVEGVRVGGYVWGGGVRVGVCVCVTVPPSGQQTVGKVSSSINVEDLCLTWDRYRFRPFLDETSTSRFRPLCPFC